MNNSILIVFTTLLLTSCTTTTSSRQPSATREELVTEPSSVPTQQLPVTSESWPMLPKIQTMDYWKNSLSSMVQEMLAVDEINDGSMLLVNTLKNDTNGIVPTGKITAVLTSLIANGGGKFQVVSADNLNAARQMLGLLAEDSLELRSKAVGLAYYLNAQYVLYSTVAGHMKEPTLDLQLMLVPTGEIIWSGHGVCQH